MSESPTTPSDPTAKLTEWKRTHEAAAKTPWTVCPEGWDTEYGARFLPILGGGVHGSAPEHCIVTVQSYGQTEEECEADATAIALEHNTFGALVDVALAALQLRALHVKRDQMIDNDTWESDAALPTYTAIANAEKRQASALDALLGEEE